MGNSLSNKKYFKEHSFSPIACETNGKIMTAKLDWTINGFKSTTSWFLKSVAFSSVEDQTFQWKLFLFPNGDVLESGRKVTLRLGIVSDIPTASATVPAIVSFHVYDNSNSVKKLLVVKNSSHVFKQNKSTGFRKTIAKRIISGVENLLISCKVQYEINGKHSISINLPSPAGSSLSERSEKLFKTMHNSDVGFRVENKIIKAHKSILISRSPVFAAMFDHQMREKQTGVVDIVDITPDTFRSVLYFMYTDKVQLQTEEEAKKLLIAEDKYMLELLKWKCEEFLISRFSSSNFMDLLELAHVHSALHLKKAALEFIPQEIARDEE